MHEYSITESITNLVLEELKKHDSSKVNRITIVLGEFRGFSPESIDFYFSFLKKDTVLSKAELAFTIKKVKYLCTKCRNEFTLKEISGSCPYCKSLEGLEMVSGKEFYIESIEVER